MTSWSDAGEMQCLATATDSEINMLTGKTILVTGAAQGIGFHTASLALRRGANVVALDRDSHRLLQAFPESNVVRLAGDVTDTAFMQHHARLLGEVDGVVNSAAIVAQGNLLECSVDQLRLSLEVNVAQTATQPRARSKWAGGQRAIRAPFRGAVWGSEFGPLANCADGDHTGRSSDRPLPEWSRCPCKTDAVRIAGAPDSRLEPFDDA